MALSRALSNINKHISTATATASTFRHQIRRNNSSSDVDRLFESAKHNGFITKGFSLSDLLYFTGKSYVFRFDVPGISQDHLRCTATGSKFSFTAEEPKPHRFGLGYCEPRYYEAQIELDPLVYQPERFSAKVNNGVLLIEIPKIMVEPGSRRMGWICVYIGQLKAHVDEDGKSTITSNPYY